MFDRFNRQISYLRISVTDRCNLRCRYCMPEGGIKLLPHNEILSFNEILDVIKEAIILGIDKIRLTGGEPLVRKGIAELVRMIGQVDGIQDLSLTTNGILLEQFAESLANAGLMRVNISVDTIDPIKYRQVTRLGDFILLQKGIEAAKNAGLYPIKINCVILKSHLEKDAQEVTHFCRENDLSIRYIREMDLKKGEFWKVQGGEGGDCAICNRLRLTSNGKIKPCLFSDLEFDVRQLGIKKAFEMALANKPESGSCNFVNRFSNIGG
jgi:cyclic pyranopterin phosphate synthase